MYTRVFNQILDSSIADNWQHRHVFEDLLKLADRNGVLDMTHSAIAARTRVPLEIVKDAIAAFESPDPQSRNPTAHGRRLVRLDEHRDWGWQIINFHHYRNMKFEQDRQEYLSAFICQNGYPQRQTPGYVYYAQVPGADQIKIGFSRNPWARMAAIQGLLPGIKVLATEKGTVATEAERHEQFKLLRKTNEWFSFESALVEHVHSLTLRKSSPSHPLPTTTSTTVVTTSEGTGECEGTSESESFSGKGVQGETRRKPNNVEEVIEKGKFIGMSEQDCRYWFRDCEACNWTRGDGTPFDHWPRQLVIHRDKMAERRSRNGSHQQTRQQVAPANNGTLNRNGGQAYAGAAQRTMGKRPGTVPDVSRSKPPANG